jgi:hypothetical protein
MLLSGYMAEPPSGCPYPQKQQLRANHPTGASTTFAEKAKFLQPLGAPALDGQREDGVRIPLER